MSPQGSDAAAGTSPGAAWRTLARINHATLRPGDQVLLQRSGVWREELEVHGGSAAAPVLYGAYGTGAAKPVIDGADPVSAWVPAGSPGIYKTAFASRVGKIFVGADPLQEEVPLLPAKDATDLAPPAGAFSQVDGTLYVHLKNDAAPTVLEVSSARRRYAIQSRNQSHFTVDGLALVRTYNSALISSVKGADASAGSDIIVRNCTVDNYGTPYNRHANDNPGDAGEGGIYLAGPHDLVPPQGQGITGILVEDNNVGRFDSLGVLDYDRAGIYLRNTVAATVRDNNVRTVTAMGIRIADNYNNRVNAKSIVTHNTLTQNEGNISIAGCDSCEVSENNIHDSLGFGIGVGTGMFVPSLHTLLRQNTIRNLLPSSDGTLFNGIDCNAGSANGTATGNRIESVANYSMTLEADGGRPCAGWTLTHNTFNATNNGMWNRSRTGRRGALYVHELAMPGLTLDDNSFQAFTGYPRAIAYGSRNASDSSKDVAPSDVTQGRGQH